MSPLPCWDVAVMPRRRRGVPQWVAVRAVNEEEAQVAAVMWGMRQDPTVAWSPGRVRPSVATAHAQQNAVSYGTGLVTRLTAAIREGRIHVPDLIGFTNEDATPGQAAAWYLMGPQP